MSTPERCDNGRLHEPTLRETVAKLDDFKELVISMFAERQKVADERDRRYEDRFVAQKTAIQDALLSQDKLTQAAFAAAEKAISKSEASQNSYNATHNDLTRKMDAQYKDTLPRVEAESKFRGIEDKIADLRESRSESGGQRQQSHWAIALAVTIGLAALSGFGALIAVLLKKP